MNVNTLFDENEEITIQAYFEKCGVKDYEKYIHPDGSYIEPYWKYRNMKEATDLFKYHFLGRDKVFILSDSGDCDGITSCVILYTYMKWLLPSWDIKILIHSGKQRGLQDKELFDKIITEKRPFVIIPDAGTNDKEQAEVLRDLDISLLVLDHHDIVTPIGYGVLVNNQFDDVDHNGSGCVVTHKFLQALDQVFDVNYSKHFIDLVALSIISDSMNVTSMQNREYLYWGIFHQMSVKNEFLQRLSEKFISADDITQRDIAWNIVPKINAICRSKDISLKQRLFMAFLGKDNIEEVCDLCLQAHKDQIELVNSTLEEILPEIDKNDNIIVYASNKIPRSYSGLIAGKVMNECGGKPTIIGSVKDGIMIGSLRSPVPLREELNNNTFIDWASGHDCSCGIQIAENNIQNVIDHYNAIQIDYKPHTDVLASYSIKNIPNNLYGLYQPYMALYGHGLPKPLFHIRNIRLNTRDISIIGRTKRTIKWRIDDIDFVLFNCKKEDKTNLRLGEYEDGVFVADNINHKINLEVIGTLDINEWNDKKNKQVIIEKYEIIDMTSLTIDDIF